MESPCQFESKRLIKSLFRGHLAQLLWSRCTEIDLSRTYRQSIISRRKSEKTSRFNKIFMTTHIKKHIKKYSSAKSSDRKW